MWSGKGQGTTAAEHIQHLHSHTGSRSIELTTHTHTHLDCAQWESPLVTQEERLCCHSLKSKSGDGVSFDVLYFHSGLCSIYSILRTEISAFISNLISPTYKGVKKLTSEIASILHNCPIWLFICNSNVLISRMCPFRFNVTSTQATRMPQVYVEIYDPPAWFKIQKKKTCEWNLIHKFNWNFIFIFSSLELPNSCQYIFF